MAPFISGEKRNYVFGGISGIAANASIKVQLFLSIFGTSSSNLNIPYYNSISNRLSQSSKL